MPRPPGVMVLTGTANQIQPADSQLVTSPPTVSSAEPDVQGGQSEDLPSTGLRAHDHDPAARLGVQ